MKSLLAYLIIFASAFSFSLKAELVTGQLPNGLWVNARYVAAKDNKPTILLIHPLQQTYSFSTIEGLSSSLIMNDYGVLTPNLSLGFSHRQQSLACEAIHTQGLQEDTREIGFWVSWLADRVNTPIIGIGHSTGALQILNYNDADKFSSMILVSLVAVGPRGSAAISAEQLQQAQASVTAGYPNMLGDYQFSYCRNYMTSRDTYLGIARWNEELVSEKLTTTKVPTDIILGTADHAINKPWLSTIDSSLVTTHLIDDADHFFAGIQEFDLHDKVIEILENR